MDSSDGRLSLMAWLAIAWLALAGSAVAARPLHVVTLGDSITKGVRSGVTAEQTFASLLRVRLEADRPSVRVTNIGIGGERTDQALGRLQAVLDLKPDLVTIMYGTNDSYVDRGRTAGRLSLTRYRENLVTLVTELLRRGIVPVLMTEPRWAADAGTNGLGEHPNVRLALYVDACRSVAADWRVPLVDHFAAWGAASRKGVKLSGWTTDGCHPNPTGHGKITDSLFPVIHAVISPGPPLPNPIDRPLKVVCFGDSVTGVYYHTGSRRAYTDMLGVALGRGNPRAKVTMVNAGISGHTTAMGLSRIDRDVLAHKPDVVTIMFGLNDMVGLSLEQYRENLTKIITRCRAAGARCVLATPNNVIETPRRPSARLVKFCDVVRRLGRELRVPVADCYREWQAVRHHDGFAWRLLMSDEIHPNMDGHKRIATLLAQAIGGRRIDLADVPSPSPSIPRTLSLLKAGRPVRVLAMAPYDTLIEPALKRLVPDARVEVTRWDVTGKSVAVLESEARKRIGHRRVADLVLLAVPRSAAARSPEAFVNSLAWIMNHSLSFSHQQWDCVVVHPSVSAGFADKPASLARDRLVRQLVAAQDLDLIDRPAGNREAVARILDKWLARQWKSR
ncbi:MAG: hypothetical protein CMJ65_14665 [Planctomycetaceae bacterium]|nr:hypothetical protein [Planctomycetaceae bacterium]